jgi:hypothetical protein
VTRLLVLGVAAWFAWTLVAGLLQPTPTIKGKDPVRYEPTEYHGWRAPENADGVFTLHDRASGRVVAEYPLADGVLHQAPEQRDATPFRATYTPSEYLGRWRFDAGGWAAVTPAGRTGLGAEAGIRLSPCRLFYGSTAPDLVLSDRAAGIGVSLFPPTRWVGQPWDHVGIGAWYLVPFSPGRPGGALGLSLTITR